MKWTFETSNARTARFKQFNLSCRQPNQGNQIIHVVVRGRVIALIQSVSLNLRSPHARVGRSWAVGREAVSRVPGENLLVVARPGPPLVLGSLPDWEHLRLLGQGGPGLGGCRTEARRRAFSAGRVLLAFPSSSFVSLACLQQISCLSLFN